MTQTKALFLEMPLEDNITVSQLTHMTELARKYFSSKDTPDPELSVFSMFAENSHILAIADAQFQADFFGDEEDTLEKYVMPLFTDEVLLQTQAIQTNTEDRALYVVPLRGYPDVLLRIYR